MTLRNKINVNGMKTATGLSPIRCVAFYRRLLCKKYD